jgi:hypothetical protein
MAELWVGARYCGPPGVANGGFASGSLAALAGGAAEITLRRPLPLDRPLAVRGDGDGTLVVEDGGVLLAEARPAAAVELLAASAAVTPEEAQAAAVGRLPRPGDRCRVVAWPLARDGRKLHAGSALLGPDGQVLAAARTVWITVARPAVAAS